MLFLFQISSEEWKIMFMCIGNLTGFYKLSHSFFHTLKKSRFLATFLHCSMQQKWRQRSTSTRHTDIKLSVCESFPIKCCITWSIFLSFFSWCQKFESSGITNLAFSNWSFYSDLGMFHSVHATIVAHTLISQVFFNSKRNNYSLNIVKHSSNLPWG